MEAFVVSFELGAGDVCVDLRRRNVGVPEHLLHGADIRIILYQMCGKRMPQCVR